MKQSGENGVVSDVRRSNWNDNEFQTITTHQTIPDFAWVVGDVCGRIGFVDSMSDSYG